MAGVCIHLSPCDVWEYFEENFDSLCCESEIIAEDDNYDIYICMGAEEETHTMYVQVWVGDCVDDELTIDNPVDAEANIADLYTAYFASADDEYGDDYEDSYTLTPKDLAVERERELNDSLEDFLRVVSPNDATKIMTSPEGKKVFENIKEHFLEYLYRKHKINIYRPMLMDYGDGCPEYEEYPYDNMEFADETNPIYMS